MSNIRNGSRYPTRSIASRVIYLLLLEVKGILQESNNARKVGLKSFYHFLHSLGPKNDRIAVVAIVKNESSYLKEWIEYHKLIGVNHFYIYDNDSTDDIVQVLTPYIESHIVTYTPFPGKNRQQDAYLDCVRRVKGKFEWLLTIDIDEFLQPQGALSLHDWLKSVPQKVAQIEIGWTIFGSNGFETRPTGLVIENFVHHAPYNFLADSKSIVRPERVLDARFPHYYEVAGKTVDENLRRFPYYPIWNIKGARPISRKKFRINHYYSKSKSEFDQKRSRGDAYKVDRNPRDFHDFQEHDRNEVKDLTMLKYARKIHDIFRSN